MNQFPDLPRAEFAFPGPLRDRLVTGILDGTKTSTTSTALEYEVENHPLPAVGARQVLVDSDDQAVGILETTDVQLVRLADVPWEHARDEGEGYSSIREWRAAHESYWHSEEMRNFLGNQAFAVDDDTTVVLERFRMVSPGIGSTTGLQDP